MSVPIVGRLRTEWRRWKGQASGSSSRRRAASRRSQVEGLEGRALLASVTEYPVPGGNVSSHPDQIVAGPDGNLWFTTLKPTTIGEMTTSGKFTVYPIPGNARCGRDHERARRRPLVHSKRERSAGSPRAARSPSFRIPSMHGDRLAGIVTGPDGALWFADRGGAIGRITTTGQVTQYPLPKSSRMLAPIRSRSGPTGRSGLPTDTRA